jgi:hypothetical protein
MAVLAQAKAVALRTMGQGRGDCPWVFPNPKTGKPFVSVYYSWHTARKAAGLLDVRMHDLRHSFASALVNRGMTLYDVKELLGHASMTTTQRYAHLAPGRLMQAASEAAAHYALPGLVAALPAPGCEASTAWTHGPRELPRCRSWRSEGRPRKTGPHRSNPAQGLGSPK